MPKIAARPRPESFRAPSSKVAPPRPRSIEHGRGDDEDLRVESVHLGVHHVLDADGGDHAEQQDGDAADDRSGDGADEGGELGTKERTMAKTAAIRMMTWLYAPVRATAPVFSE